MEVYVVEIESGSSEHGNAMIFDSVHSTLEGAEKYCEKFKTSGAFNTSWDYEITPTTLY